MRRFLLAAGLALAAVSGAHAQSPVSNLNPVTNGSAPTGHIAWPVANPVWEFDFYRPANTTLPDGTGLEIRNLTYRGREVLDRASVPVLNVQYTAGGGCGCYRDWQDIEVKYESTLAPGGTSTPYYMDAAPGSVRTNCERSTTGPISDSGQFSGVAVEDYGTELVLTGHTSASWYRYRVKWHFYADGRIWPEYSFASSTSTCTANPRRHHAYWRFDFDLENTRSNDVVTEIAMDGTVTTISTEASRLWGNARGSTTRTVREWAVTDATTQAGFTISPGIFELESGTQNLRLAADDFSKMDALVLRYATNEVYDGITYGSGCAFEFENPRRDVNGTVIGPAMLNSEPLDGADTVFWYRSSSARTTGTCELRGPTLRAFGYDPVAGEDDAPDALAPVEVQAATPNPFTPQTSVRFRVAEAQAVRVVLYDALGRQVRILFDAPVEAGVYETVEIQGGDLPAGTYVVRVEGTRAAGSTRIVLAR